MEESEASVCVARGRDFTDLRLCRLQAGRVGGSRRLRYSVQLPNGIVPALADQLIGHSRSIAKLEKADRFTGGSPDRNARKVPSDCAGGHPKLATATFWQWPTVG